MKKSLFTAGAVTFLAQGIGLANVSSGSSGLSKLELWKEVSSAIDNTKIVQAQDQVTADLTGLTLIFDEINPKTSHEEYILPSLYKAAPVGTYEYDSPSFSVEPLAAGQYKVTIKAQFKIKKLVRVLKN